jgi:hypothetical protein
MNTNNFYQRNASKIYPVLMNDYDEETGIIDNTDDFIVEQFIDDIDNHIEAKMQKLGYEVYTGRNYLEKDGTGLQIAIATIQSERTFEGIYFSAALVATINFGHYEGASLDYEYEFTNEYSVIDSFEHVDDFINDAINKKGLSKKEELKEQIKTWIYETIKHMKENLESIYDNTYSDVS